MQYEIYDSTRLEGTELLALKMLSMGVDSWLVTGEVVTEGNDDTGFVVSTVVVVM